MKWKLSAPYNPGMDFYGADLAHIHDQGFGWLARGAAEVMLGELQPKLDAGQSPHVAELGCGSGLLTELLCAASCSVTALDFSPAMVALARGRAPQAQFGVGSIYDFPPPACDAVCLIGEVVNYCAAAEPTEEMLRSLFTRVHAALSPEGFLLFDSAGPGRAYPDTPKGFVEKADWAVLFIELEDADSRFLTRQHTTYLRDGELFRRSQESHKLRLWPPDDLTALLKDIGFSVERLTHYGSAKLPRGLSGFLARKPGS